MKTPPELLAAIAERLGWTLLHSLWQGAVIALVLAAGLHLLRGRSAAARHAACLLALLVLAASTLATLVRLEQSTVPSPVPSPLPTRQAAAAQPVLSDATPHSSPAVALPTAQPASSLEPQDLNRPAAPPSSSWRASLEPLVPWLSALWAAGVLLLSLRHFSGWWRVQKWRRRGTAAQPALQQAMERLRTSFGLPDYVRLLESVDALTPMLTGVLKPVVLLPARVITGLSAAELEAILAHELAHLARRDAWSNSAQLAIETLFFYHPAVWWIGHCARQEREHAADDLALRVCTDRRLYAGALTRLAELQLLPSPALAATGGNLLARIRRIVQPAQPQPTLTGWNAGVPALLTLLAAAAVFAARADDAKTIPVTPDKPATFDAHNTDGFSKVKPEGWIDLSLVPQVVEFEGFINYGSPIATASPAFNALGVQVGSTQTVITPNVINQPIFSTRKLTTSVSIFDGQNVVLGGLVREGVQNVVSPSTKGEPLARTPEEPVFNADDAKTWVADAFQLEDKAKREAAIERIRAALTSGNVEEVRTGITAFTLLGPIEFDKASFRPAVRALLASRDVPTRAKAASAFTMTGAEPDDLPRIFALADDTAPEVREYLAGVIVQLTNRDLRDKAASDAILKLMANLPRDSRSVAHAMWGVKLSPEIEARVIEFCREIDHASNSSVGYNFFYGTLSTQANKSEASCQRLIELLAHQDTTNIAGRSAWGLQQGVDRAQFPLVAGAMMKVIEARSDGYLRNNALRCLRAYGNAAQAPALRALLAKPGVTGEMRKPLEETLASLEARPAGAADSVAKPFPPAVSAPTAAASAPTSPIATNAPAAEKPEIEVEWKGKWWPATVLKKDGERTQIHYLGYGSEWDEWVTAERIRPLSGGAATNGAAAGEAARIAELVDKNRRAARTRADEDRQRYSWEQLQEIEKLYQVANAKGKRDPEAVTSLKQLLEKYDKANRTGCATLYLGQASLGDERIEYLTRAVEKFSDCYYFNGCQVGGYGRYVLALTLWEKGEKDKARALFAELKTTYKNATDHRGRPMIEAAEAAEKELEARP